MHAFHAIGLRSYSTPLGGLEERDVIQYRQASDCPYKEQEQRQDQRAVNDAEYYDRNQAALLEKLKNAGLLGEYATRWHLRRTKCQIPEIQCLV